MGEAVLRRLRITEACLKHQKCNHAGLVSDCPRGYLFAPEMSQSQSLLLAFRESRGFHFREQLFIKLRIHHDLIDDYSFRRDGSIPETQCVVAHGENSGLQDERDLKAINGPKIAVVNFHRMVYAIEAAWLAFDFYFEEAHRVDPHVERMPSLLRDLDLIGVAPLHLFGAVQCDLG